MNTPTQNNETTISAEYMARKAYFALLEAIANAQHKLVEIEQLRNKFGDKALVPNTMLLNMRSIANAKDRLNRYEESLLSSLNENYKAAEYLEKIFAAKDEAEMDAMAAYFGERMKEKRP